MPGTGVERSQLQAETTSADDFASLFGDGMMDSFGGSQMSIEELLAGGLSGHSRTSDNGASGEWYPLRFSSL